MKGIGLILLFIGVGFIAYALNASDSINSAVALAIAQKLASIGNEPLWLLIGGSGAVVVGMTMIFKRPASSKN